MVSMSRLRFGLSLVVLAVVLVSCSAEGRPAPEGSEIEGEWVSTDVGTSLTISQDGAFSASGVPVNLVCESPRARTQSQLSRSTRALSGTWRTGEEGFSSHIWFEVNAPDCLGSISGDVWQNEGLQLQIVLYLDPTRDPEQISEESTIRFIRQPEP